MECAKILLFISSLVTFINGELNFTLSTSWDGVELDAHDHVHIMLTNKNGYFYIEVDSEYFGNPIPEEKPLPDECPQRPLMNIWEYEDIELFFANNKDQYIQIVVNPQGRYNIMLFDGYRNEKLNSLFVPPDKIWSNNPCQPHQEHCAYTVGLQLPSGFMPPDASTFNAYAMHIEEDGTQIYEALYPVNAQAEGMTKPDFHKLDTFQTVDWAQVGYTPDPFSYLWKAIETDNTYEFGYDIMFDPDCQPISSSEDYFADIYMARRASGTQDDRFLVVFWSSDNLDNNYEVPSSLKVPGPNPELDDSESYWLVFSNDRGDITVLGMNPYGAYRLFFVGEYNQTVALDAAELPMYYCYREIDQDFGYYYDECILDFPADLLPAKVNHFQYIHSHYPNGNSYLGALCPGQSGDINPMMPNADWKGCLFDIRTVLDEKHNQQYSTFWNDFLNGDLGSTSTTTEGGQVSSAEREILSFFVFSITFAVVIS